MPSLERQKMRIVEYEFRGQKYSLCLNAAALYDIYEKFGTEKDILEIVSGTGAEGFSALCWVLAKLNEQGVAVKRYLERSAEKPLSEVEWKILLSPHDAVLAKEKIAEAVIRAFTRNIPDDEEIDLGLLELEKKTEKPAKERGFLMRLREFLVSL